MDQPISYRILKPEASRDSTKRNLFGKAYVAGNIVEGNKIVTEDNWKGGVQVMDLPNADKFMNQIKVDKPFAMAKVTIMPTEKAYLYVLGHVGATLPVRDPVDIRIIKQVITGTIEYVENSKTNYGKPYIKRRLPEDAYKKGIIEHPDQVGGYPEYKGTPYKDSDNDGMPDEWEIAHKLNPGFAGDASLDRNKDGYTNIEEFLNSLVKDKM